MPRRYHANNFSTTLATGIGTGATSITLTSATGLPAIGANEVYRLTLRYQGRMEIVEVTDDASSPTLTVTRAQESTTAQVFPAGSLVELRVTANSLDRKQDQTATAGDVIDFGAADSFEIPNSATPTVNANGEIALDTSVADWSHGLIKYFGGEELFLVALPIAAATTPTNGYVVAYNSTNDEFELVAQSGGGITWSEVTGTTQAVAVNNGYIANNASRVNFTLPATAAVGNIARVGGKGSGGWQLTANTGQTIQVGAVATTTAGNVQSANRYDTIEVVCITANTTWLVLSGVTAGYTIN